nr:hypothetical protein [Haloarchaeobius iranensis]
MLVAFARERQEVETVDRRQPGVADDAVELVDAVDGAGRAREGGDRELLA